MVNGLNSVGEQSQCTPGLSTGASPIKCLYDLHKGTECTFRQSDTRLCGNVDLLEGRKE